MTAGKVVRLAAFGLALFVMAAGAEDWTQWRGSNRDGIWNETGIIESFPATGLKIAWRAPVGAGWSSPVIAQGRVYVTDSQVARPMAKERVLCFSEADGTRLWTHEYSVEYPDWAFDQPSGPRATPNVHQGKLFTLGATGHLLCLDAATGKVVWKKDLARDYQVKEFTGITGSPLIENQLLILNISGKPSACVVGLDKNSGKEVWRAMNDSFTYSSPITLTAGGKRQLIVWTQEAVTSLDPGTGQIWWREVSRVSGDTAVSTPVFGDHRLLVGGLMFKLDANKPAASVLWPNTRAATKRILSNTSTALLQGKQVFSAITTGELVCLESDTGQERWSTNTVTSPGNGSSIHLTLCGDAVFLFTDRGDLIRAQLTPQGYREISRAHLLEPTSPFGTRKCAWTPPAYANRHVFARSDVELVCASLAKP